MKRRLLLLCTAACAALPLIAQMGDPYEEVRGIAIRDHLTEPECQIARVIDGDTVEVVKDGQLAKVRLVGVDAPETVHPNKPIEPYGPEASEFLWNLLAGEYVWFQVPEGETEDKYGRLLAYLYREPDGLFVNLEIVRQGYGRAEVEYPNKYLELFRWAETDAQANRRGLWRGPGAPRTPSAMPAVEAATTQADPATGAVEYLRNAARDALHDGAPQLSYRFYQAALALAPNDQELQTRVEQLRAFIEGPEAERDEAGAATRAPPPSDRRPAPRAGNCPRGGNHVPGKRDRNGRLHCAKCGRFI